MEFTLKNEHSLTATQRIQEDTLLQRWRESLEVSFTLVASGRNGGRQTGQTTSAEGIGLLAGRVVERHACLGGGAVGGIPSDRALIIDLRAGLATHLGQAILGESEGFSHGEFRHRRRPRWSIGNGQRLIDLTSTTRGISVNQVGRQQLARA